MQNFIVSTFSSLKNTSPVANVKLIAVLNNIKNGKYKELVEPIFTELDKTVREELKSKLPLFTPTGLFEKRSIAGMIEYNGFICLDIDNVDNIKLLKESTISLPFVYAAFITPSGKGLKVLIKTNATKETYKEVELKVSNMFCELTGAARDNHCKDISRVQYISYDPELYLNENSNILVF